MHCETAVRTVDGVGLVAVRLRNPVAVPRRVRVENRLDGPVCPPRRDGVPEPGWDRDGVTVRVDAGGRRALGYACPMADESVEPVEPAATVANTDRASDDATGRERRRVREAVHRLGRPGPPRDAVPAGATGATTTEAASTEAAPTTAGSSQDRSARSVEVERAPGYAPERAEDDDSIGAGDGDDEDDGGETREFDPAIPTPTSEWLEGVRGRVDAAEALTDPEPAAAADALAAAANQPMPEQGSPLGERPPSAAVEALAAQVDDDAATLRSLATRVERLADRAAAADPSTAAIRTLIEGREER
ncbi:MAG: hypothetical protein ABEJ79_07740 [Halolamina sp.]